MGANVALRHVLIRDVAWGRTLMWLFYVLNGATYDMLGMYGRRDWHIVLYHSAPHTPGVQQHDAMCTIFFFVLLLNISYLVLRIYVTTTAVNGNSSVQAACVPGIYATSIANTTYGFCMTRDTTQNRWDIKTERVCMGRNIDKPVFF